MRISSLTLILTLSVTSPVTTSFAFVSPSLRASTSNTIPTTRPCSSSNGRGPNGSLCPRQSKTTTNLHDSFLDDQNIVNINLNKLAFNSPTSTSTSTSLPSSAAISGNDTPLRNTKNAQDFLDYSRNRINNRHAAKDWFHNIASIPKSTVLKDIRNPVLSITGWSTFISILYRTLQRSSSPSLSTLAPKMCIGSHMHSLMISSLGLLLVFRTNSAYQRFVEGRKIWEQILGVSRNIDRMVSCYQDELSQGRVQSIKMYLASFPYLLRHHIRPRCLNCEERETPAKYRVRLEQLPYDIVDSRYEGDESSGGMLHVEDYDYDSNIDEINSNSNANTNSNTNTKSQNANNMPERPRYCWIDRRNLPWRLLDDISLRKCANSINRPLWACNAIANEVMEVPYSDTFTSRERLTLISQVDKLSNAIGQCERIHQTAVPLNYARHALRSLTIWLFTLPFALVGDIGLLTGPISGVIAWLMFGVYQIGHSIEDPFQKTLRLSILCNNIRTDVLGENQYRSTSTSTVLSSSVSSTTSTSTYSTSLSAVSVEVQEKDMFDAVLPSVEELVEVVLPQS